MDKLNEAEGTMNLPANVLLICEYDSLAESLQQKISEALRLVGINRVDELDDVFPAENKTWLPEHANYDLIIAHWSNFNGREKEVVSWQDAPKLVLFSTVGIQCLDGIEEGIGRIEKAIDVHNCIDVFSLTEWREILHAVYSGADKMPVCTRRETISTSGMTLLSALDILLQGYLAVWKPEEVFGEDAESFMAQYHILKGDSKEKAEKKTSFLKNLIDEKQRLFRPGDEYAFHGEPKFDTEPESFAPGWYWFDECLTDVMEKSWEALEKAIPQLSEKESLEVIWTILRGISLQQKDCRKASSDILTGQKQDSLTKLIAGAHKEYVSLLN